MPENNNSVVIEDLMKKFGNFVAVDHINLTTRTGEIFGFLGPNGAGKSTTIRMLCGLLTPTSGRALVAGYDVGGQRLVWSSSEIMTHVFTGGRDVALLYGRAGESGSTVLRYRSRPDVRVLDGTVRSAFDQMLVRKGLPTRQQLDLIRTGTKARGIVTAMRATGEACEDYREVELDLMVRTPAALVRAAGLTAHRAPSTAKVTRAAQYRGLAPRSPERHRRMHSRCQRFTAQPPSSSSCARSTATTTSAIGSPGPPANCRHISCATDGVSGPLTAPAVRKARAAARLFR